MKNDREKLFHNNLQLWAKTCPKQAVMLPYVDSKKLKSCLTDEGEENLKTVIDGQEIPLHSQEGAVKEADAWFQSLPLKGVPLVCIYGVGLGYYYDAIRPWLKKGRRRRVVFLEDDLAVIQKLLETERGSKILQDPQVQLLHFNDSKADEAIFEGLYWNFAMARLAVTSLTSYSDNKKSCLEELRHKIAYDAAMKNALVDEYMRYGASFFINFYQNIFCLDRSYLGNHFFGKFYKVPAIICGAGPSLAKNLPLVRQLLDKAIVFAGGSALNVLNGADFQPHFGAGIDPNPAQYTRLSQNRGYEVPFFYRNRMYHNAFKMIHGPRLYITGSGGYDTAELFEERLGIKGGEELDEGHNVVNFCVEVAHAMGCDPIIFVGMDLAFTGMREYAPGVVDNAQVSQSAILEVEDEDSKAIVKKDVFGEPTYTLWKWVAESDWLSDFAKNHPLITMINCTEGGLGFPGVPNEPLEATAKKFLTRSYEINNRIHGETQNSAIPKLSYQRIQKVMKELSASLKRTIEDLGILLNESKEAIVKIKAGQLNLSQSGRAALAETELAEEIGYKYVVAVFNEVYAHLLSGDVHEIQVRRYSEKQRQIKRLELSARKFTFLSDVAKVNDGLIEYAFSERKKHKVGKSMEVELPPFDPGMYDFTGKELVISDPECDLFIHEEFNPILVPEVREDGEKLDDGHVLRVIFDHRWKLYECYVEKEGKPDGQSLLFYSDGSIKAESFYVKGKLHGPSRFWSDQGQILAESYFIQGKQQGKSQWFYPSGALYSLQRHKNGIWNGPQEYYYEDGVLKTLMYYNDGKLVGEALLQLPDGTLDRQFI